jgi:hypothetical protein
MKNTNYGGLFDKISILKRIPQPKIRECVYEPPLMAQSGECPIRQNLYIFPRN